MLVIDGSFGEGGGQILRTALALSLITRTPLRLENIRAKRRKPGLMRQHLTSVLAAAAVGGADVRGAELGSTSLELRPTTIVGGAHRFSVGTAGSAMLVLQTVLPALLGTASTLVLEGGTHNPMAPTFDFVDRVFLPLLRKMGAHVTCTLERAGFYPAGGGRITVAIEPSTLAPIAIPSRGAIVARSARVLFAALPFDVVQRELDVLGQRGFADRRPHQVDSAGAGNVVMLEVRSEHATELVTSFGERGFPAEQVAHVACDEMDAYLAADVPIGRHLADQLLLPMALARGGSFRTQAPTLHTTTQLAVIGRFLDVRATCVEDRGAWYISM